jgi:citrate lyase subunit beta / citryl-CoA lyase
MRSLLFVPADSPRKLDKAFSSGADALILDLEDSVAAANKGEARRSALAFLRERRDGAERPRLYVRVNAFDSGLNEADLDAVMTAPPDGVVLPKSGGGADLALLASRLAVREALHGLADGTTRILAIATETAAAIFALSSYCGASPRLAALAWGGEDLSADIGALVTRSHGEWTEPFRLARNLCLFAAAAAGVSAIDTVYTDFRDLDGLKRECEAAARDGFSGKLAVHPAQVPIINAAFTPNGGSVERAGRIVAAFARSGGVGVTSLDGMMLDRPHLRAAERLLARAGRESSAAKPPRDDPAEV